MRLHRMHRPFMTGLHAGSLVLALGMALSLGLATSAAAQTEAAAPPADQAGNPAQTLEQLLSAREKEPFVYRREGRPDPFFPFLTQEILKAEARAKEELPGMQRFEPGQLTLVAIIFAGREPIAMVQDSTGIGYVLKKGTKIGTAGKVVAIDRNRVVIEQAVSIPGSDQQTRKVEMTLKREGEI